MKKYNKNENSNRQPSKFQDIVVSIMKSTTSFIETFVDETTDFLAPIFNGLGSAIVNLPNKIYKVILNMFYNKTRKKIRFSTLIFLGAIVSLTIGAYAVIEANKVPPQIRPRFDKSAFTPQEQLSQDTQKLVTTSENGRYSLIFDETTSYFHVIDTVTEEVWSSNVLTDSPDVKPSVRNQQKSILTVYYQGSIGGEQAFDSYEYSISEQKYSVKYNDDGLEILYNLSKNNIYYIYFPKIISNERMEELVLSKITDSELRTLKFFYNFDPRTNLWRYKSAAEYEAMPEFVYNQLKPILIDKCGYTVEDQEYDNAQNNVEIKDKYPVFQVGLKYTITNKGLDVQIINESIQEKSKMPITKIEVLKYFGAASVLDEGYMVIPDGSGAIINLNNGKTHHKSYVKRIYGRDNTRMLLEMPEPEESINMPIFGMKRNDSGFLAIVDEGAPMTSINADVSGRVDSYNKIYPTFHFRETDTIYIQAGSGQPTKVDLITDYINETNFSVQYEFLAQGEASYVGMAEKYKEYLLEEGFKENDHTSNPVMNLTVLGGYQTQEFFLGVPYNTVRSLTSYDESKIILDELKQSGVSNINLIYSGWMNGGMKHSIPSDIDFDRVVGTKRDFQDLINYMNDNQINFYPEIAVSTVYDTEDFAPKDQASRAISGDISKHYPFNLAALLPDVTKDPYWILNPDQYDDVISDFIKEYEKFGLNSVSLQDFTSSVNGTYKRQNVVYRTDSLNQQIDALNMLNTQFSDLMVRDPLVYALKYSESVVDLPVDTTKYKIIDYSIPLYQLALSGLIDYAGPAFNIEDQYSLNWHKLKAIETGSNLNFTWSYKDSSHLMNTEYDYYYSTYYRNWINEANDMYEELDELGIYQSEIINHEIITPSIRKVTYSNGLQIIVNYGDEKYYFTDPDLSGRYCQPRNYYIVKGAN